MDYIEVFTISHTKETVPTKCFKMWVLLIQIYIYNLTKRKNEKLK